VAIAWFVGGLIVGGLTTASGIFVLSGVTRALPSPARLGLLGIAIVVLVIAEFRILQIRLPQNHRQIPQEVFMKKPARGGLLFGWELGTGVLTYVPSASPYLIVSGLLLLTPDVPAVFAAGAGFGIGRASMLLSKFWSGSGQEWDDALESYLKWLPGASVGTITLTLFALSLAAA
jgi:hypothetical protein